MTVTLTLRTTAGPKTVLAEGNETIEKVVETALPNLPSGVYTYKVEGVSIPANALASNYDGKTIMIVKEIQGN